jgi:hypothetical protein
MDGDSVQAITAIAETITSIGILLCWIYAERKDNHAAWSIIESLVRLRLKQIEQEAENKENNESLIKP